tara:strand:- start:53 stop:487 length:435 start_codon:yes stop_codon:yes gene_type:complete
VINTIYAELPRDQITYVVRSEFVNGQEQEFHDALKKSIAKSGMKDPIFIHYQSERWGNKLKVIAGQNRMVIAEELNIKIIPCIITQFDAENSKLKGRILNTDEEIKSLFHAPEHVVIRRREGYVYSTLCNVGGGRFVKKYHELY